MQTASTQICYIKWHSICKLPMQILQCTWGHLWFTDYTSYNVNVVCIDVILCNLWNNGRKIAVYSQYRPYFFLIIFKPQLVALWLWIPVGIRDKRYCNHLNNLKKKKPLYISAFSYWDLGDFCRTENSEKIRDRKWTWSHCGDSQIYRDTRFLLALLFLDISTSSVAWDHSKLIQ